MLSKQIAYILFGVIISLSVAFVFFVYSSYTKNQNSEEKINNIISQFEEKFKNDSIYLTNANKILIDKISQHIIDSMSVAYEEKLENAILEAKKYKQLLIANNISLESPSLIHSNKTISNSVNSNSVTTYSKLHNRPTEIKKTNSNKLNITTVSKLKNQNNISSTNITTYSKVNTSSINTSSKNKSFNITTYSKLNKTSSNGSIPKNYNNTTKNSDENQTYIKSNKNLTHNNYQLDHAQNINDLDKVPIYRGCENLDNEDKRKNCFAINISKYILTKFNSLKIQNSDLKKGMHKVRVLFIIDKEGKAKIEKLVGKWPHQIYKNVKFAVETTPPMKPGYSNNKAISVKYSLLIPFIIK
jgi:hypothetical protein